MVPGIDAAKAAVVAGFDWLKEPTSPLWWWGQFALRAAYYIVGLTVLGAAVDAGNDYVTAIVAVAFGVVGIGIHRLLAEKPDASTGVVLKIIVCTFLVEVGAGMCVVKSWQVFSIGGFFWLSLMLLGAGQLTAEVRAHRSPCGVVSLVLLVNCLGALVLALAFNAGGWPLLLAPMLLTYPLIWFGTEYVLGWLDDGSWGERCSHALLGVLGVAAVGVGAALVRDVGGWRFSVLLAVVVVTLVLVVASNTDSDILIGLFVVLVIVAQMPRSDIPATKFVDGRDQRSILVLGDSYASGEGAQDYFEGTNTKDKAKRNECRRSVQAWAVQAARQTAHQLDFVACSGANALNIMDRGQYVGENPTDEPVVHSGEPGHILSQLEIYDRRNRQATLDWAFISIGGNDAGFGDLVAACLAPGDCSVGGQPRLDALEDTLQPKLRDLYKRLNRIGKLHDKVVVVPYPVPIAAQGCDFFDSLFTENEHLYLNGFTQQMNAVIRNAAAAEGVRFVGDMPGVFETQKVRICDTDAALAAVNYFGVNPVGGEIEPRGWVHNSMHPKESGHDLMTKVIVQWIKNPTVPEAASTVLTPALSLTQIMCGANATSCAEANGGSTTEIERGVALVGTRQAIRHHLPGILLVVIGSWVLSLAVLARRRVVRNLPVNRERPTAAWLDGLPLKAQAGVFLGLFITTLVFLLLLARLIGLTGGYGAAQSETAGKLVARTVAQWQAFRKMGGRDMVLYVPAYLSYGIAVVRYLRSDGLVWPRRLAILAIVTLVAGGTADLAETYYFRRSLSLLIKVGTSADIEALTTLTRFFTLLKVIALVLSIVLLGATLMARHLGTPPSGVGPQPPQGPPGAA